MTAEQQQSQAALLCYALHRGHGARSKKTITFTFIHGLIANACLISEARRCGRRAGQPG